MNPNDPFVNKLLTSQNAILSFQGKIVASSLSTLSSTLFNPSVLANLKGFKTEFNVNTLQNRFLIYQTLTAIPTLYGNFSFGYTSWDLHDNVFLFSETYGFYFGYAFLVKDSIGIGINFIRDLWRDSISFGVNLPLESNVEIYQFLGFWNLTYSGSVTNLNIRQRTNQPGVNPFISHGLGFDFIRFPHVIVTGIIELGFTLNFQKRTFSVGSKAILFDWFVLGVGSSGNEILNLSSTNYGGGLRWNTNHLLLTGLYSLENEDSLLSHSMSIQVDFRIQGKLSRQVLGKVTNRLISPKNNDAFKDYSIIKLHTGENSVEEIVGWKLQIVNIEGYIVKVFSSKNKIYTDAIYMPDKIIWNGRNNFSALVKDGKYFVRLSYQVAWGERFSLELDPIFVDNRAPNARILVKQDTISIKKGDLVQPLIINLIDLQTGPDDIWFMNVHKPNQNFSFLKREIKGRALGSTITWDGKDQYGKPLFSDSYQITIRAEDAAGNSLVPIEIPIQLLNLVNEVSIRSLEPIFSPNNDNQKDSITLRTYVENTKSIVGWKIEIVNSQNKFVYKLEGKKTTLPKEVIQWDGKDTKGRLCPEGLYQASLYVDYVKGTSRSIPEIIIIDKTPPEVEITFEPDFFSPDGDGIKEFVTFTMNIYEAFGLSKWHLKINDYNSKKEFRSISNLGKPPRLLNWDGTGNAGQLVPSLSQYEYFFSVWDKADNFKKIKGGPVNVDFLIFVVDGKVRIDGFGIVFPFSSSVVTKALFTKLNIVGRLLNTRLINFALTIEGHSDKAGSFAQKYAIGLQRSLSVKNYFVQNFKVATDRIIAVSFADKKLKTDDPKKQDLNRRVEFAFEEITETVDEGET